jgi:uncharacterized membrane protein
VIDFSPAHIHLLLNHFPTIGFVIAIGLFAGALVAKSDHLIQASLVLFVSIAFLAIGTYVTGSAAAEAICRADPADPCVNPLITHERLDAHESAAMVSLLAMVITGGFAWLGLWQYRQIRRVASWNLGVILALAVISIAAMSWAANLGGEINHPEIRLVQDNPPAAETLAQAVRQFVVDNSWVWITLETLHFVGLTLVIGVLLLIWLRALGVLDMVPFAALDRLLPWAALGLGVNVITGMLFVVTHPDFYIKNPAFYWKLVFLMIGGANLLYFFFDRGWASPPGVPVRALTKLTAGTALLLWLGVMYWGAMLPYIGNSF